MQQLFHVILVLLLVQNGQSAMTAVANVHADSTTIAVGTLLFYQRDESSPVRVVGIFDGLKDNTVHGLHVHRDALMEGELNCTAAGPHFNPYNTLHGPREADIKNRHIGDLGNVTVNEKGVIVVEIVDPLIDLYNATRSIANRTIVLHAMRDDGGKGGFPDSNTTGNAGPRVACGVITSRMEISNTKKHTSGTSISIGDFFEKLFS